MFTRARHVCFDKDGTLTDVHVYWRHTSLLRAELIRARFQLPASALTGILEAMGIDTAADRIRSGGPIGYYPRDVVIGATLGYLTSLGVEAPAESVQELFAVVDRRQQETNDYKIEILPGVREFLEYLRRNDVRISVFSSDRRENILNVLRALTIDAYFAAIVGGGCVRRPKPHPDGFLLACERVGVVPSDSIYIGDTVEDMKMASLGRAYRTIGVATGLDTFEDLSRQGAHVCARLDELVRSSSANGDA